MGEPRHIIIETKQDYDDRKGREEYGRFNWEFNKCLAKALVIYILFALPAFLLSNFNPMYFFYTMPVIFLVFIADSNFRHVKIRFYARNAMMILYFIFGLMYMILGGGLATHFISTSKFSSAIEMALIFVAIGACLIYLGYKILNRYYLRERHTHFAHKRR